MTEATVHASAATVAGRGVLIRGAAGSGKSSLILQLLTTGQKDTALVADDRVVLRHEADHVIAAAPDAIAGLLEIRGQGIVRVPFVARATVDLVVDLMPAAECPRLPAPEERAVTLCGVTVARIFVASGTPDGGARVRAALRWPLFESTEISAA
jgi:serine kinase of HPr protein (carbohydrate metabolism regulator)